MTASSAPSIRNPRDHSQVSGREKMPTKRSTADGNGCDDGAREAMAMTRPGYVITPADRCYGQE